MKNLKTFLLLFVATAALAAPTTRFKNVVVTGGITGNVTGSLTGNASTATQLNANPADCNSDNFASSIDSQGNLTCSTVGDAGLAVSYLKADGSRVLTSPWNAGQQITAPNFTGSLTGNASTATTATLATGNTTYTANQYGVVVSGASNAMTVIAPDASTTKVLVSGGASAAPSWQTVASGGGGIYAVTQNLLTNSSWESVTTSWTESGGTYTRTTTAASIIPPGVGAASWDSSSASQTFTSNATTITSGDGLSSKNAVGSCAFKCDSGTCTHTIQGYDGSNILGTATITSSTTGFARTTINFPFPASGTAALRVVSVASDEPTLYVDDCYLGLAEGFNTSQVSQAQFIGSAYIAATASCNWSRSSTSYGTFATVAACPGPTVSTNPGPGTIQTTDTDLPKFTVNNLAPGVYRAEIQVVMSQDASANAYCRIYDGTTQGGWAASNHGTATTDPITIIGWFTYTAAGNKSFEVQCGSSTSTVNVLNASAENDTRFSLTRFPTSSEQAIRPDQNGASWAGYHDNTCIWTRTNTAFGDPAADASCTLTQTGNTNFGTVTSALSGSDKLPGIVFTPNKAGSFYVCATPLVYPDTINAFVSARLTDGTNVVADGTYRSDAANMVTPMPLCGRWTATSTSSATLKIQIAASSGVANIQENAAVASAAIRWTIFAIDQTFAAPILVGSVTSNSTGIERMERAFITNGGTCTLSTQSGSWLSSVTDGAAGVCTLNVTAGIFSAAPTCTATNTSGGTQVTTAFTTLSSSSIVTKTMNAGATADADFSIICMGPR